MSRDTGPSAGQPTIDPRVEWSLINSQDRGYLWSHNHDTTHIAAVEGGWLFRFRHYEGESSQMSTQGITFVPDPGHRWDPKAQAPQWERLGGMVNPAFNEQTSRMRVQGGWVYRNTFATRGRTLTIALVFVPGDPAGPPPEAPTEEEPVQPQPQAAGLGHQPHIQPKRLSR